NRLDFQWTDLFVHFVSKLKLNVIYHHVTLRFELQPDSSSFLTDSERVVVGNLLELLPKFCKKQTML
ncbi:unnamed protein product, partial [Didymodactylos carnosus]